MMQALESCTWRILLWLLASECSSWRQDHIGRRNNSLTITAYRIENLKRVYLDRTQSGVQFGLERFRLGGPRGISSSSSTGS
ncbi:hypothetical protein EDB19DRAFT_1695654, partial [Suillus lakei]